MKIAVLATHPIQYQAPWFRALDSHAEIDAEVWYCHNATPSEQGAAGFGINFDWDVSLLEGYKYRFLKNVAEEPTVAIFRGLNTPEVGDLVKHGRYDAIIVHGWHYRSAWQTMRACWKFGTPVMVRSDSHLRTERGFTKPVAKWPLYRWFIPKLDACLAAGEWSKDYFLHYGARSERVFIVPHCVDTNYFRSAAAQLEVHRLELRESWDIDKDAVVFLFVGKFIEKKRPMDFIRSIERAAGDRNSIIGLMVGDGPLRADCEGYVEDRKVPVRFTGFLNQTQIVTSYVAADALVLPSDGGETWGMVVNEAMTCGLPCLVSSEVGCGPDLIASHETGAVFPLGDIGALADHLKALASDRTLLSRLGRNAQQKSSTFSVHASAKSIVEAVRVCLGHA